MLASTIVKIKLGVFFVCTAGIGFLLYKVDKKVKAKYGGKWPTLSELFRRGRKEMVSQAGETISVAAVEVAKQAPQVAQSIGQTVVSAPINFIKGGLQAADKGLKISENTQKLSSAIKATNEKNAANWNKLVTQSKAKAAERREDRKEKTQAFLGKLQIKRK